jgi:hypothetical protein
MTIDGMQSLIVKKAGGSVTPDPPTPTHSGSTRTTGLHTAVVQTSRPRRRSPSLNASRRLPDLGGSYQINTAARRGD